MVSLAGLLLTGIDLFTGIAVGTIMVVGVAVVGSLTLLPALLSLLGPLGRPRPDPVPGAAAGPGPAVPAVGRAGAPGGRRPLLWGGTAALALLALAAPALGMRTGTPAIDLPSRAARGADARTRSSARSPDRPPRPGRGDRRRRVRARGCAPR